MNFKLNTLLISALVLCHVPVFAEIPQLEANSANPLDKKTEFVNNHLIAFSAVKQNNGTNKFAKKFIAFVPKVGSNKIVVYEIDAATNALTESSSFTEHLYSPMYITFDPSGLDLYGVSSTHNFITQYVFDPVSKKYVHREVKSSKSLNSDYRIKCDDNYFSFDYFRTLQFFPGESKAYVTCKDKSDKVAVIGYQYDAKTGALLIPPQQGGKDLVEVANPLEILITPSGHYLYSIDNRNQWHQYKLNSKGHFEPTGDTFKTAASKIDSMTFGPNGKDIYVVAQDSEGRSVVVQYQFDPSSESSGKLSQRDVVVISRTAAQKKVFVRPYATYIQFTPSGKYAYVLDNKSNLIYQYGVDPANGKLKALNPATFITCSIVHSLAFDTDLSSNYAYAAVTNKANLKPQNDHGCQTRMSDPFELHIDRLVVDPASGQLRNF